MTEKNDSIILDGQYYNYKKKDYNEKLRTCIETTFMHCLSNSTMDSEKKIESPVMMFGKIQSGKTRAFTGLIALAFDNGFNMVFILTKNSEALVSQTVARMDDEFSECKTVHATDIMKAIDTYTKYELEQVKQIFVAKKETQNIDKLLNLIQTNPIMNSNCLIIDDEADTTGIGYEKEKNSDDFSLRAVSSRVNTMRGSLNGCVFVQVTATPYALFLQPAFNELSPIKPIKPIETVLVPPGEGYIGEKFYFLDGIENKNHPSNFIFEPMSQEECDYVSDQKKKRKKTGRTPKTKLEDGRSFKMDDLITNKKQLPVLKKALVNFILGTIVLRELYNDKFFYCSFAIHTATHKNSHDDLNDIVKTFFEMIKNRTEETSVIISDLFNECYEDIKNSVECYNYQMPDKGFVKGEFYKYIEDEYISIVVVNSNNDKNSIVGKNGQLKLRTPCSIFIGGQVLDRGITIDNMIGFYYGRNPKTFQMDTVLQHSRMFGYREKTLPVTRFYTTERIFKFMRKIASIDEILYEEIKKGEQGHGVYFIERHDKGIKPCAIEKILLSDIVVLKSHQRILPVGFSTISNQAFEKKSEEIENLLSQGNKIDDKTYSVKLETAEQILKSVYSTIKKDENNNDSSFVDYEEFITLLKCSMREKDENSKNVIFSVYKGMKASKYKKNGDLYDAPDTGSTHLTKARKDAESSPVVMLFEEKQCSQDWDGNAFWWPVLVFPKNVPNTIYSKKELSKKIVPKKQEHRAKKTRTKRTTIIS